MDRILRELYEILRIQYDAGQEYLVLAQEQLHAVVNNRLDELQDVNVEIDQFTARFEEMDADRIRLMERLAQQKGSELVRLSEMLADVDHVLVPEILEQAAMLRDLLGRVTEANLRNQKILKSSREFVRSNMAILTGYTAPQPQTKFATYGANGRMNMQRQQQIRIVNRSF
jgi:flagellar biosynthesis/type III secretory pathway chaperone